MDYNFQAEKIATDFMYKVYGWMSAALAITAGTAFYIAQSGYVYNIVKTPYLFLGLILAQLVVVLGLNFLIQKISFTTAASAFLAYSVLNGLTLSVIFLAYTNASIVSTFIITAGMFATMAIYGYYTRTDLTSIGSFMRMLLFGLIIGLVVNMFLKSTMFEFILSIVGVIVFTVLTAFDVQKIKEIAYQMADSGEVEVKIALLGALTLYLDFINLFLSILRLIGKRRD